MASGGKREGAGRKPLRGITGMNKTIRFTQDEWNEIVYKSAVTGFLPSEYVRLKTLGSDLIEFNAEELVNILKFSLEKSHELLDKDMAKDEIVKEMEKLISVIKNELSKAIK